MKGRRERDRKKRNLIYIRLSSTKSGVSPLVASLVLSVYLVLLSFAGLLSIRSFEVLLGKDFKKIEANTPLKYQGMFSKRKEINGTNVRRKTSGTLPLMMTDNRSRANEQKFEIGSIQKFCTKKKKKTKQKRKAEDRRKLVGNLPR